MRRPHWRKMTWVLIIWCAIILIWAIAGGASANHQSVQSCLAQGVLTRQDCQNAADAGTGIGVALILVVGFVGFVFFSLIWLMSRPKTRDCPVCGTGVKRGKTVCPSCGHDFVAASHGVPTPDPRGGSSEDAESSCRPTTKSVHPVDRFTRSPAAAKTPKAPRWRRSEIRPPVDSDDQ